VSWSRSFLAFDTETTGFGPTARILELGIVVFEDGELVHQWSQLFEPQGVDWGNEKVAEALAVNKITRAELAGKPTFEQKIADILFELSSADVWVAHNAAFDAQMLQQEIVRTRGKLALPSLLVDTMTLSGYMSIEQGHKLAEVAARYNIRQNGAHRAVADAETCGRILQAMVQTGKLPSDQAEMLAFIKRADVSWKSRRRR
jgi:ATP-dependent DNA helicase DinG